MVAVALEAVSKSFGGTVVLQDVSLSVQDGEFFCLTGPSGCGKTLLLRIIAGLEQPDSGSVRFDGRDVTALPPNQRELGMVFQSYALYPHLAARGNIAFPLRLMRLPGEEVAARVEAAAARLERGMLRLLDRRPHQLSAGHRQRVAIGRAVVREPRLLLFDEPLANLDAHGALGARQEMKRECRRRGVTVIYATPDAREAFALGDRVAVMSPGKIEQVSSPLGLWGRPANRYVADFVHQGCVNLYDCTVEGGELVTEGARLPLTSGVAARLRGRQRCVVGIRPDQVRLTEPGLGHAQGVVAIEEPHLSAHSRRLYIEAAGFRCIADVPVEHEIHPGMAVGIVFDLESVYLFESESGMAVY